jgi:hypothetical protein
MNLSEMIREGSLADHDWMGTEGFDLVDYGSKNQNNVKERDQFQWGLEEVEPIFESDEAGIVGRDLTPDAEQDASAAVKFARHLMNSGAARLDVDRALKHRFPKTTLRSAKDGLRDLFRQEGVVGRFVLDATGYESCRDAMASIENSPFKRFVKNVIGCTCGDPHLMPDSRYESIVVESTGIAADDFLADETVHKAATVSCCPSTHLRLMEGRDDLDEQWMDSTLVELGASAGLPDEEISKIKTTDKTPTEKVRAAFCAVDRMKRQGKARYCDSLNASDFMLEQADNEIGLDPIIDPQLEIDEQGGDMMEGVEVPTIIDPLEVMINEAPTGEFEGVDIIDLDPVSDPISDIDIDMKSEMTW